MDGLGFVFEPWLDTQLLTDHDAERFEFEFNARGSGEDGVDIPLSLSIDQGTFCHTKEDDRTGAVVWDDSVVMASHFCKEMPPGWWEGKTCIELGSGCGFLGIVTSCLGAKTLITDQAHIVPLLERNAQKIDGDCLRLGGSISCCEHSWGTSIEKLPRQTFDVIVASGVVYHEEAIDPLLSSLRNLSTVGGTLFFLGVDFRFDVANSDRFPQGLPVVAEFLKRLYREWSVQEIHQKMKASVRLYVCKRPFPIANVID